MSSDYASFRPKVFFSTRPSVVISVLSFHRNHHNHVVADDVSLGKATMSFKLPSTSVATLASNEDVECVVIVGIWMGKWCTFRGYFFPPFSGSFFGFQFLSPNYMA